MPRRGGARRARARRAGAARSRAAAGRRRRRQRARRVGAGRLRTGARGGNAIGITGRNNPRRAVVILLIFGDFTLCVGLALFLTVSSSVGIAPLSIGGVCIFLALVSYFTTRNRPTTRTVQATATEHVVVSSTMTAGTGGAHPQTISPNPGTNTYFGATAPPQEVIGGTYGGFASYPTSYLPTVPPYLSQQQTFPEGPPPSYEEVMK